MYTLCAHVVTYIMHSEVHEVQLSRFDAPQQNYSEHILSSLICYVH